MSLTGKTLFITGASRGIGKAIALRAARDGAIVAKTERPHPKLPGTIYFAAEEIEAAGGEPCRCRWTSATTPKSPKRRSAARSISGASTSWSITRV